MSKTDLLLEWLQDAHSMEKALAPVLEDHAHDAKDFPELQARLRDHVRQTQRHADLLEGCINRLGGKVSGVVATVSEALGSAQSLVGAPFKDEVVKNGLADYATENLEIESYKLLINTAKRLGDTDTARVCEMILQDEQAMARWLDEHMMDVAQTELDRRAAEQGDSDGQVPGQAGDYQTTRR